MPKLMAGDTSTLIPEGEIVHARLQSVEERSFPYQGQEVEKLQWTFLITDEAWPGWNGKEVVGDTSTNFNAHPNCKAYNWVTALTGRQYAQGEELDTDDLMGLPCQVAIMHKPDKTGRTWMRVREVFPAKRAAAATTPENNPF